MPFQRATEGAQWNIFRIVGGEDGKSLWWHGEANLRAQRRRPGVVEKWKNDWSFLGLEKKTQRYLHARFPFITQQELPTSQALSVRHSHALTPDLLFHTQMMRWLAPKVQPTWKTFQTDSIVLFIWIWGKKIQSYRWWILGLETKDTSEYIQTAHGLFTPKRTEMIDISTLPSGATRKEQGRLTTMKPRTWPSLMCQCEPLQWTSSLAMTHPTPEKKELCFGYVTTSNYFYCFSVSVSHCYWTYVW